jgi:hypothetical protein
MFCFLIRRLLFRVGRILNTLFFCQYALPVLHIPSVQFTVTGYFCKPRDTLTKCKRLRDMTVFLGSFANASPVLLALLLRIGNRICLLFAIRSEMGVMYHQAAAAVIYRKGCGIGHWVECCSTLSSSFKSSSQNVKAAWSLLLLVLRSLLVLTGY